MCFWRGVHNEYTPLIGEIQYSLNILIGKTANLIHHAMKAKIISLTGAVLEYAYKENVDDGLNQYIRTFRTYSPDILYPVRHIVIFLNSEL